MSTTQITSIENLGEAIQLLEKIKSEEELILRKFNRSNDNEKSIKLIRRKIREVAESTEIQPNILSVSVSLTAGYLTKKLFEKVSTSPFKKIFGTVIMFGITNILVKHPEVISKLGERLINILRKKPDEHVEVIKINPGDSPFQHDPVD
jgi:hypothetical protein